MTQTTGRFFDEIAKFMTDAAGAAQGARSEVETAARSQAERFFQKHGPTPARRVRSGEGHGLESA